MSDQKSKAIRNRETEQLTELLSLLHLALKHIQLYPAGHTLVQDRLVMAHRHLSKHLTSKQELLFGIARSVITYGDHPLGENSPACSSFAKILSSHEVASLKFSTGISQHSLFLFLKAVGILPEHKKSGQNIQQEIVSLNISHIQIERVDYSYFDSKNIPVPGTNNSKEPPLTWLTFTQKLTSGQLDFSGTQNQQDSNTFKIQAPKALATAINNHSRNQPEIIQQFSILLDQMLKQSPNKDNLESNFGGKELSQTLASLKPELRDQFIAATLKRCDQNMTHSNPEKLLETFSDAVVLDMAQQVTERNVRVSPPLFNLIEKLSAIRVTQNSESPTSSEVQKHVTGTPPPDKQQHAQTEYQNSLKTLALSSPSSQPSPSAFPLQEYLITLEEEHLSKKIIHATLIILDKSENEAEYKELAHKLLETSLSLPDGGEYDLLQVVVKSLKRHIVEKESPVCKKIARHCLQQLTAPEFLDYIYSLLPHASETERERAVDFLELLCPDIIGKLLKISCMKPKIPEDDVLIMVFRTFRAETLSRIFTILPKTTTINVKRLLVLIQYLGVQGIVRLLHPFLDNDNSDIRLQVLNLLLPTHDTEALAILTSMLESKDESIVNSAIELCNTHSPQACVPHLLKLLEYQFFKVAAIERNQKLFMALGHIGNPKALPSLEKIAFTKWLLQRQKIIQMKQILFYSLKGYPPKDRKNLLRKGLKKINDEKIHQICNALLSSQKKAPITI